MMMMNALIGDEFGEISEDSLTTQDNISTAYISGFITESNDSPGCSETCVFHRLFSGSAVLKQIQLNYMCQFQDYVAEEDIVLEVKGLVIYHNCN